MVEIHSRGDKDFLAGNAAKGLTPIESLTCVKTERPDYNESTRKRKTVSKESSATKQITHNARKGKVPALTEDSEAEADENLVRPDIKVERAYEIKKKAGGFPYLDEESDDDLFNSDLAQLAPKAKRASKRSKTASYTPSKKASTSSKSVQNTKAPKKSSCRGLELQDPDQALPSIENGDDVALAAGSPAQVPSSPVGDVDAGLSDHDAMDLDASEEPVVDPQAISRADAGQSTTPSRQLSFPHTEKDFLRPRRRQPLFYKATASRASRPLTQTRSRRAERTTR